MMQAIRLLHRYLGIGIGLLMVAWCLSGIVMLYVPYPSLAESTRRASLEPLRLEGCCDWTASAQSLAEIGFETPAALSIEMLAGRPVMRFSRDPGAVSTVDLRTGGALKDVSQTIALQVALRFSASPHSVSKPRRIDRIDRDQWTVSGSFDADRPLYRIALDDDAASEIYVSSRTGRAVQHTSRSQRFWNYSGAVVHWVYPTLLRQNQRLWSRVVITLAALGSVLTTFGVVLAFNSWLHRPVGKISPFQGLSRFHHVSGLIFGPLLLFWVASGLISMNPGGWLIGDEGSAESRRLRDSHSSPAQLLGSLQNIAAIVRPDTRQIEFAPLAGVDHWMLRDASASERFSSDAHPSVLNRAELIRATSALAAPIANAGYMPEDDAYFFGPAAETGAWRVVAAGPQTTRYYLDSADGRLLSKVDRNARWYRWIFSAVHQWNFGAALRENPLRSGILLSLLAGVSSIAITGLWMALRRIGLLRRG